MSQLFHAIPVSVAFMFGGLQAVKVSSTDAKADGVKLKIGLHDQVQRIIN